LLYHIYFQMDPSLYPNTPKEMQALIESAFIPSIEILVKQEEDKVLLAGGFIAGEANEGFLIVDAPSNEDLSHMMERTPVWHLMKFRVRPLERFKDRLDTTRKINERLKSLK
jgi:hypothetical protein